MPTEYLVLLLIIYLLLTVWALCLIIYQSLPRLHENLVRTLYYRVSINLGLKKKSIN
jgi:hypothetical protein